MSTWLNEFKIALVQKDIAALDTLLGEHPSFSDLKEMEEAAYLLSQANELITSLRQETKHSLQQIEKNIRFLKSTATDAPSKLDLTL